MKRMLDLKIDLVFKMFFSRPANKELLIDFVTAFIQPVSPIEDIEIINPFLINEVITDKNAILDLRLKLDTGAQIDVEMQVLKYRNFRKRIVYYWSKLHQSQMSSGDKYELIKPTISIVILDYEEFKETKFPYHVFEIRERTRHELLTDDFTIHFLELPKLENAKKLGHIEKWGRFFYGVVSEEDEVMAKAQRALMELSEDQKAYQIAFDRDKAITDRINLEADQAEIMKVAETYKTEKAQFDLDQQKFQLERSKFQHDQSKFQHDQSKFQHDQSKFQHDQTKFKTERNLLESEKGELKKKQSELNNIQSEFESKKRLVTLEEMNLLASKKKMVQVLKSLNKTDEEIAAFLEISINEIEKLK